MKLKEKLAEAYQIEIYIARLIKIEIPDTTLSQAQIEAINKAIAYGSEKGVKVIITVGR